MSAAPPTPPITVPPALVAALGALGPWGMIGGLALTFGLPFVEHLIQNITNNTPVTAAEWNALKLKISTPYEAL